MRHSSLSVPLVNLIKGVIWIVNAKSYLKIKLFFSFWAVVGAFQTRKWPVQLLMTSEVLGLSLQIMLFSGLDRAVQSLSKVK